MASPSPLLGALNPARNAVVSACAGSGKTWLLVSRMIRLLLDGAAPSELLAITFTRKAAEEMKDRLFRWLEVLAVAPDEVAVDFLRQRGMDEGMARAALPAARGLFEAVLMAAPGPMITTFHGWFLHLLGRAPLQARGPSQLVEDAVLLTREAWLTYADALGRRVGTPEEAALRALLAEFPLSSVRELLDALLAKRAEWWAWAAGRGDPVAECGVALAALAGVDETTDIVAQLFAEPDLEALLREYLDLLERNGQAHAKAAQRAARLAAALAADDPASRYAGVCAALLKEDGTPYADYKAGNAMDGRLGGGGRTARFFELHRSLADRVAAAQTRLAEQRALRLNRWALTAGLGLLAQYQRLKAERDVLDFTDAEWSAWRLLADEEIGPAVLARLDARWRHVLLDEFQDTNPLQWQILKAWLDAYGLDGERPTLFLVGDPKQSIYRFRRAEPRLFQEVASWLARDWGALHLPNDTTRRLAPRIAAWVNAVFGGRPDYPGFHTHTAHEAGLPGLCEVMVAPRAGTLAATPSDRLRDPLSELPYSDPHPREVEARRVAERMRAMAGRLAVRVDGEDRPARYSDIYVLAASRTDLAVFEQAFKAAGIPYLTARRGGLLNTLEAADLIALITWLVSPTADLALAQVLRSPLFAWTDEDLLALADRPGGAWADRLAAWAGDPQAPEHVSRASALLAGWLAQAGRVPAHDLLDRIFHEGQVEARYAAAVPAHLRPGVLANLGGLLALSLKFSGGRYPSLPRFLDELRALRDRAGDEAPDEPPAAAGDAVRLMTIHAAKGLEAPIVFLIKADDEGRGQDRYGVLLDWPPDADRPAHFSLYGKAEWRGMAREALFAQERALHDRERLNLLYVAMTRAKQALVVSGLEDEKGVTPPGSWLAQLGDGLARADLAGLPECCEIRQPPTAAVGAAAAPARPPATPVGERRQPAGEQAAWGVLVHRYLELAGQGWQAQAMRRALGCDDEAFGEIREVAEGILRAPHLRRFFDPAEYLSARDELEFVDAGGELRRIDRLVEFADEVWVLDYKTGGLAEPDPARRAAPYLEQMGAYRLAMSRLYPDRPVRTALIFADGMMHEIISE